jgi:hypothetical protein
MPGAANRERYIVLCVAIEHTLQALLSHTALPSRLTLHATLHPHYSMTLLCDLHQCYPFALLIQGRRMLPPTLHSDRPRCLGLAVFDLPANLCGRFTSALLRLTTAPDRHRYICTFAVSSLGSLPPMAPSSRSVLYSLTPFLSTAKMYRAPIYPPTSPSLPPFDLSTELSLSQWVVVLDGRAPVGVDCSELHMCSRRT